MERCTQYPLLMVARLRHQQVVVDVNVDSSCGRATLSLPSEGSSGGLALSRNGTGAFWWRSQGNLFQTMYRELFRRSVTGAQGAVGQVTRRFLQRSKIGRGFHPPHRKFQREGNQRWVSWRRGQDYSKFGNISSLEPNPIESIGYVNL